MLPKFSKFLMFSCKRWVANTCLCIRFKQLLFISDPATNKSSKKTHKQKWTDSYKITCNMINNRGSILLLTGKSPCSFNGCQIFLSQNFRKPILTCFTCCIGRVVVDSVWSTWHTHFDKTRRFWKNKWWKKHIHS